MTDAEIVEETPTPPEYRDLRARAGLTVRAAADTARGLTGSWFAVVARDPRGAAIGMGRVIGDGALFLQIVDIAVDPAHQGHGLGRRILTRLLEHVDQHAPHAYVSLIADPAGHKLYTRCGFVDVAPSLGMKRLR